MVAQRRPVAHQARTQQRQAGPERASPRRRRFLHKTPIIFLIAKPCLHYLLLSLSLHHNPLHLLLFRNPCPRRTPEQSNGREQSGGGQTGRGGHGGAGGVTARGAGPSGVKRDYTGPRRPVVPCRARLSACRHRCRRWRARSGNLRRRRRKQKYG